MGYNFLIPDLYSKSKAECNFIKLVFISDNFLRGIQKYFMTVI